MNRTGLTLPSLLLAALLWVLPGPASAELLCSPEDGTEAVQYRDDTGRVWSLVDFRFAVPAWQRPHLACNRWVESLGLIGLLEIQPLYGAEDRAVARLGGESRRSLYRACAGAPPCHVTFPHNLLPDGAFLSAQVRSRRPGGSTSAALCEQPTQVRPLTPRPPARRRLLEGLSEVRTWFTPVTRLSDEVALLVREARGGAVLVSTMTVDPAEAARLTPPEEGPPVFVVFDLNSALAEGASGLELFQTEAPGLYLVPAFNTPQFPRYYHLKGAAAVGGDTPRLVFTGANLKSYDRMALFDLGFSAQGKEAAGALGGLIARQARRSCASAEALECTLDARFAEGSAWPERIRGALRRSCEALARVPLDAGEGEAADAGPFIASDREALMPELLDRIASARRSVTGSTHHLDAPEVVGALSAAEERVPTRVYVGAGEKRRRWVESQSTFARYVAASPAGPAGPLQAHTKALLIDGESLVWGTGNFTRGGLGDSVEVLFETREPVLVDAYRRYLATLARSIGETPVAATAPSSGPVVAWIPPARQPALDRDAAGWRDVLLPARAGLDGFFVASGDLARCLRARDPATLVHDPGTVTDCVRAGSSLTPRP